VSLSTDRDETLSGRDAAAEAGSAPTSRCPPARRGGAARPTHDDLVVAGRPPSGSAASNGVGDLRLEIAYLHAPSSIAAQLVHGTEPFDGNRLV
jgi:hypothetical protein